MADLVELPVPPIVEESFTLAANGTHVISVQDYRANRQDLPGGVKILEALIDNGSNSEIQERNRAAPIRSSDRPTLRFPSGATAIVLEEQDGFATGVGEIKVEITFGVDPSELTRAQRKRWGIQGG